MRAGDWMARARGCSVEMAAMPDTHAPTPESHPITPSSSSSADAVCATAAERQAVLIILGAGLLAGRANTPGTDDVLGVAARSTIPLWIVPPRVTCPPCRILLGTEFSRASIRAGRIALHIVGPAAHVDLAHVTPERPRRATEPTGPSLPELVMLFDALDSAVGPLSHLPFGRVLLRGEPASALLACAVTRESEMLAVGSHGRYAGAPPKSLGRVAGQIVSAVMGGRTRCSLLLSGLLTGEYGGR